MKTHYQKKPLWQNDSHIQEKYKKGQDIVARTLVELMQQTNW